LDAIIYREDAVQPGDEVWVIHAFQKKSTRGIRTPQPEIDLLSLGKYSDNRCEARRANS